MLCGCKTDMLDLTEYEFENGVKASVCGFCKKQLLAFNKNPSSNSLWARQLLETDTKGVRPEEVEEAFRHTVYGVNPAVRTQGVNYVNTAKNQPVKAEVQTKPLTQKEEFEIVKKQLYELQKDFKKFKKRYYLSKILGIVLPISIVLLLIIILFASGALQNIFDYYAQLSDWANY